MTKLASIYRVGASGVSIDQRKLREYIADQQRRTIIHPKRRMQMKPSQIAQLQQDVAETRLAIAKTDQEATEQLQLAGDILTTLVELIDPEGETADPPSVPL